MPMLTTLSKEERRELAQAIDDILRFLRVPIWKSELDDKLKKVVNMEKKLVRHLLSQWDEQGKKAVKKAAEILGLEGEITEPELQAILNAIAHEMGPGLQAQVQEQVTDILNSAYILGKEITGKQVGIKPTLSLIDFQAREWLAQDALFWIGDYYDKNLGATISEMTRHLAIEQGLGRKEVGRQLKAALGDQFAQSSEVYWRGLAATAITRARSFGGVQAMVEAQVDTYEILPVGDERTCPTCMEMAKHTFKVEHAVKLRDAVLNAKRPEDIKSIHPWLPFKEVQGLTTAQAARKGLALPPYHFHCRCTYVVSSFRETVADKEPLPISFVRDEPVKDELPESLEKLTYVGSGAYLGGTGEKHIYQDKAGQKYLFKPALSKAGKVEEFRAYVQEVASEIARRIYDEGQFVQIKVVRDSKGRLGTLQKLMPEVEGDLKKISWKSLSPYQLSMLQREHVLDWTIGNFDSHGGNFILLKDGRVLGIDKEQAFRYIGDKKSWKMSLDYHPNKIYGEQEPIYNTIYRAFANKEIDLDLQTVLPALQRLEAIPDSEYRAILRPYAESLLGKGAKAESFLDQAVRRKNSVRAQYEAFFTELLKARDPKYTGQFKFLDQIAAVDIKKLPLAARTLPKEELEKLNVKALKAMAKEQNVKYYHNMTKKELIEALADPDSAEKISIAVKERLRARLEAAKLKPPALPVVEPPAAGDIMENLNLVGKSPYGTAARKDGPKIEGQVVNIRRIEDNGRTGFQLTFKVTQDYHKDVERALNTLGASHGSYVFSGGRIDRKRGVYQMGGERRTVTSAWVYADGNRQIFFAGPASDRALLGQVEIRIYETDGVKAAKKLQETLKQLNLADVLIDPTPEEDRLLRLSRLAWQHAPREDINIPVKERTPGVMEEILRKNGVDPSRADKLVEREVWPGYKTFVEEGMSREYKKAGAEYLFSGVGDDPAKVLKIFAEESPGLMSTMQRFHNGIFTGGASQSADISSGGADSAFVRLVTKNAVGKYHFSDHFKGYGYRLIFDVKELERTDWYAYGHDAFGTTMESDFRKRLGAMEFVTKLNSDYRISNEIMFRRGIRKESIIGITCDTSSQKQALMDRFMQAGIKEINGKPLDRFIKVQGKI